MTMPPARRADTCAYRRKLASIIEDTVYQLSRVRTPLAALAPTLIGARSLSKKGPGTGDRLHRSPPRQRNASCLGAISDGPLRFLR